MQTLCRTVDTYAASSYFLHSQEILKKMSGFNKSACQASK